MSTLTAQRLGELLYLDPDTWELFWRVTGRGWRKASKKAGGPWGEYLGITIDRKTYLAHRLVWLYVTGKWPPACVRRRTTPYNMRTAALAAETRQAIKGFIGIREQTSGTRQSVLTGPTFTLGILTRKRTQRAPMTERP
jgi:hypothetical protein